uniref:Uncharacterized protein n=1 Tax=Kwoniella pini CBS 10737 TaxID=1296096 RepID=A0A1B9I5A0_9TREE|nr:uncharacterized protein I206_02769 [Kwoniella pini CBS 10737]OCF50713.1 hypothetical protein I206_02769 [Kwoniella pini CBS 10737]
MIEATKQRNLGLSVIAFELSIWAVPSKASGSNLEYSEIGDERNDSLHDLINEAWTTVCEIMYELPRHRLNSVRTMILDSSRVDADSAAVMPRGARRLSQAQRANFVRDLPHFPS